MRVPPPRNGEKVGGWVLMCPVNPSISLPELIRYCGADKWDMMRAGELLLSRTHYRDKCIKLLSILTTAAFHTSSPQRLERSWLQQPLLAQVV
jgi:hypothetical protein